MTENEWRTGTDFAEHVRFVHDRLSPRRQRLLAVAFCRAAGDPFAHPDLAAALDVIDRSADGDSPAAEVERARQRCRAVAVEARETHRRAVDAGAGTQSAATALLLRSELAWAVAFAATTPLTVEDVGLRALTAVTAEALEAVLDRSNRAPRVTTVERLNARLRGMVWEVAGNPFRAPHFAPEWRTDTAVALARQMYEARDFSATPILADALQDAGCDAEELLAHCRDTTAAHVRGCWAVDAVLGME